MIIINHKLMPIFITLQKDKRKNSFSRRLSILTHNKDKISEEEISWEKVLHKVYYSLIPNDEQNMSLLPIGSGISFYKGLINQESHLHSLQIKIPDTYCIIEGKAFLYNSTAIIRLKRRKTKH